MQMNKNACPHWRGLVGAKRDLEHCLARHASVKLCHGRRVFGCGSTPALQAIRQKKPNISSSGQAGRWLSSTAVVQIAEAFHELAEAMGHGDPASICTQGQV